MEPIETVTATEIFVAKPDANPRSDAIATTPASATVIEELLIEEISIDGMCGVY